MSENRPLSAQELFGVVVRCLGIYLLITGSNHLISAMSAGVASEMGVPASGIAGVLFLYVLFYLFAGFYLLTRADRVVSFAYPVPMEVIPTDPK